MGKAGENVHNQERISKEYQKFFSKFLKKGGAHYNENDNGFTVECF